MERAIPLNLDACCDADLAFHRGIIAASRNIVLQSLIGAIETALRASFLLTTSLMENQSRTLAVHKNVMDCIRFRDTAGARASMNHLLDLAQQDLGRVEKRP
jgi:DNA-binding FadR family transcriptional regulator